jgi:hypothetical protein
MEVQENQEGLKVNGIYHLLFCTYGATSLDKTKSAIKNYMCVHVSVTGCRTKSQHKDS